MEPSVRLSHKFSLMSHLEHFQPLTQEKNTGCNTGQGYFRVEEKGDSLGPVIHELSVLPV